MRQSSFKSSKTGRVEPTRTAIRIDTMRNEITAMLYSKLPRMSLTKSVNNLTFGNHGYMCKDGVCIIKVSIQ